MKKKDGSVSSSRLKRRHFFNAHKRRRRRRSARVCSKSFAYRPTTHPRRRRRRSASAKRRPNQPTNANNATSAPVVLRFGKERKRTRENQSSVERPTAHLFFETSEISLSGSRSKNHHHHHHHHLKKKKKKKKNENDADFGSDDDDDVVVVVVGWVCRTKTLCEGEEETNDTEQGATRF